MTSDQKTTEATAEEARAIASLKRLARRWPKSLWLFSASGTLNVMKTGPDGDRVRLPGCGGGMDSNFSLDTINIPNDGGDW